MCPTLLTSNLTSLRLLCRGKVRDNYEIDDRRMLMVATDRLSAFDVVMGEPIPGKGEILTEMALFWFARLSHIVQNHLTGEDPESVVLPNEREQVRGRSMVVKRLRPLPVEAVVRGYLAGSGWLEYQKNYAVCGVELPQGMTIASKLPSPIFTPATKAAAGDHDENIDFGRLSSTIGQDLAEQIRTTSLLLYSEAAEYALRRGIIIADTKFEFGLDESNSLTLMDEVLTPDSSRFWPVDEYVEGVNPPSFDKQFVRDWLEAYRYNGVQWNKRSPAPPLDGAVISRTAEKYREALNRLIG